MSSQHTCNTCSALKIVGNSLEPCIISTNDKFCNKHSNKYRLEKPDECPICFDKISVETETPLECGHWIHKSCLQPTNLHKCSLCQSKMTEDETTFIFGEGHVEQNNFNDGTSIFWNASQENDDAYAEFGHGSDNSDDEPFQGINDDDRLALLEYDPNDITREEIDDTIEYLSYETLNMIVEDIEEEGLESEFISVPNIMTIIPRDEEEYIRLFINDFVETQITIYFNRANKHVPENVFEYELDECIQHVHADFLNDPNFNLFIMMLWNFETLKCNGNIIFMTRRLDAFMSKIIIEQLEEYRKEDN